MPGIDFMGQDIPLDAERVATYGVDVSVAAVERLRSLPNLKALNLNTSDTTDELLALIGALVTLEDLDVSCTNITDAGTVHLRRLIRLQHLRIKENALTDALVPHLLALPELHTLNLKSLPLSDAAISRLSALEHLELVVFSGLKSRAGVEALKRARPACDVILDGTSL